MLRSPAVGNSDDNSVGSECVRRTPCEGQVRTRGVLESNPAADTGSRLAVISIIVEVDVLVLERLAKLIDEDVVAEATVSS